MEILIKDQYQLKTETDKYIRELELANDSLQDENDKLRNEIGYLRKAMAEASSMKTDQILAEVKRDILDTIEKMPAEKIRDMVVDIAFDVLEEAHT